MAKRRRKKSNLSDLSRRRGPKGTFLPKEWKGSFQRGGEWYKGNGEQYTEQELAEKKHLNNVLRYAREHSTLPRAKGRRQRYAYEYVGTPESIIKGELKKSSHTTPQLSELGFDLTSGDPNSFYPMFANIVAPARATYRERGVNIISVKVGTFRLGDFLSDPSLRERMQVRAENRYGTQFIGFFRAHNPVRARRD